MGSNWVDSSRACGLVLGAAADAAGGKRKAPPGELGWSDMAAVAGVAVDLFGGRGSGAARFWLRVCGTAMTTWGVLGGAALARRGSLLARGLIAWFAEHAAALGLVAPTVDDDADAATRAVALGEVVALLRSRRGRVRATALDRRLGAGGG